MIQSICHLLCLIGADDISGMILTQSSNHCLIYHLPDIVLWQLYRCILSRNWLQRCNPLANRHRLERECGPALVIVSGIAVLVHSRETIEGLGRWIHIVNARILADAVAEQLTDLILVFVGAVIRPIEAIVEEQGLLIMEIIGIP